MLVSTLTSKLLQISPGLTSVLCSDDLVVQMLFLSNEDATFQPDTLYIVLGERALTLHRFPHDTAVIYRDEAEKALLIEHFQRTEGPVNLLYVPGDEADRFLNTAQEKLRSSQRDSDRYTNFLRMIIRGKDLYFLLSEAAKQCNRQLVALDFSGKILGHSPAETYLTEDWREAFRNAYCPADFMQHLHERLLTRSEITIQPFSYLCDETGLTYLSSPVIIQGSPHGYVFLLSKTPDFDPIAYELLPILSKVVGDYLQQNTPDLDNRNQLFHGLVRDILRGESPESVQSRISSTKLILPKHMRVMAVHSYYIEREKEIFKTLRTQLSLVFGLFTPLRYENSLMILQDVSPECAEKNAQAMDFLENLAATNRLYVGISNEFSGLSELAEHYAEAVQALKLANRLHIEDHLIYYRDMAFYSMLCSVPSGEKLKYFCHPALSILQRYDAENGTELLQTLRVYINVNCNQKQAAEALYTHRNTISYRRQQIVELTGIDFQNSEELFQLNYSFKIFDFMSI